jgi:L-iditol 2-dehydrogenase
VISSNQEIPPTMRAAVLYDVDDIRIEKRPVPALEPGDVLVRTGASGICSGDLMPWYVRRKAPFVFGHEPAGTVVAVAVEEPGDFMHLRLGKRVFAHHHAPCLDCVFCARGDYVQCPHWRSTSLDPGGMAEFFRVPRANLLELQSLPDDMSFITGSLVEPLACVVKSLQRAGAGQIDAAEPDLDGRLSGRSVYVVGLGVMGLMHVAMASALGATTFGSDFRAERRALAAEMGAHVMAPDEAFEAVRAATMAGGADIVICGPGTAQALQHSIESVAPGGTVVMFAPLDPKEPFAFDQASAYFRDVRLVASYSCGYLDTKVALALLTRGIVTAEHLGAVTSPFSDVGGLYRKMQQAEIVKGIVTFDTR